MPLRPSRAALAALLLPCSLAVAVAGCGDSAENEARPSGGGGGTAGAAGGSGAAGAGLTPFSPPADPGPGKFLVTVSGEDFALNGFPFQAGKSKSGDPAFVDGWAISFSHVIPTYGEVTLHEGPDTDPADKSKLGGEVARLTGPFAVDLAKGGPLPGKGGPDEQAVALGVLDGSFDTATRYALSYTTVKASPAAKNVNLDAEGLALYGKAVERGWAVVYAGTATWNGGTPPAGSVFEKMPKTVTFVIGLANPTRQLNCENPDLGKSAFGEDFARGVQPQAGKSVAVQLTYHTDHLFWDRLEAEQVPLHFDVFAARSSGFGAAGTASGGVTIDDLAGADISKLTAKDGTPIPFRSLVSDYAAPAGTLAYEPDGVKISGNDLVAWLHFTAAASSHLNADGECLAVPEFSY